jgi:response regulator of citrate/malate metabolism
MTKVLIVEDDPMVAQINKNYIESVEGFQVVSILEDGKEALEFLYKNQVDLIILDVYMPKLDGISFLMEMRKRQIDCDVIMVTAAREVDKIHDAMQFGVVDYLIKPFEYERLKKSLENYALRLKLLKTKESVDQKDIDAIIMSGMNALEDSLPKGLNKLTLNRVISFIEANQKSMSGDEIAEGIGVTKATVRRYMNYLEKIGFVKQEAEYGSLGRPLYLYKYIRNKGDKDC